MSSYISQIFVVAKHLDMFFTIEESNLTNVG